MDNQLQENDTATYGDICVRAGHDTAGTRIFKVQTDKGQLIIRPSASNTVTLESTAKTK